MFQLFRRRRCERSPRTCGCGPFNSIARLEPTTAEPQCKQLYGVDAPGARKEPAPAQTADSDCALFQALSTRCAALIARSVAMLAAIV